MQIHQLGTCIEYSVPRPSPSTHLYPARSSGALANAVRAPMPASTNTSLQTDSPVWEQLERILRSRVFAGAHRSRLFLRYVVEHAVAHPSDPLKEYSIALDVFDRAASYDPAVNNTVRVEAGRLRSRLLEYYAGEGSADPLLIEVPKGSYRVLIHDRHTGHPIPAPTPLAAAPAAKLPQPPTPARLPHLWALPLAFLLGAFIGYRASH